MHGSGTCFMAGSSRSQWPGENLLRSERDGSLPRPCCDPFRLHHPPRNKARHAGTRKADWLGIGCVGYACGWISLEKPRVARPPPKRNSLSAPTTGDESGTPPPVVLLPTVAVPLTHKFQRVACGHTAFSAGYGWHTSSLRYLARSNVLMLV